MTDDAAYTRWQAQQQDEMIPRSQGFYLACFGFFLGVLSTTLFLGPHLP